MNEDFASIEKKLLYAAEKLTYSWPQILSKKRSSDYVKSELKKYYEDLVECYQHPVLKAAVAMVEWNMIKNIIQNDHCDISHTGIHYSSIVANSVNIFQNYNERIKECESWTQDSIDYASRMKVFGQGFSKYMKMHPVEYMDKYLKMHFKQLDSIFLLNAYHPSALSDQKHVIDSILGCAYFERRQRGGIYNRLRKLFNDSYIDSNYRDRGILTEYNFDEHVKRAISDLSWVNYNPLKTRRSILKGNWSPEELKAAGIDINNLARSLNQGDACFKNKNNMIHHIQLLSPLIPSLTGEVLVETETVLNRIMEMCPHHLINEDIVSVEIERVLSSDLSTPTQKLAAAIGARTLGKGYPDLGHTEIKANERKRILKNVLGSNYKTDVGMVIRLMKDLGLNTKSRSVSKIAREGLMSDLGI